MAGAAPAMHLWSTVHVHASQKLKGTHMVDKYCIAAAREFV